MGTGRPAPIRCCKLKTIRGDLTVGGEKVPWNIVSTSYLDPSTSVPLGFPDSSSHQDVESATLPVTGRVGDAGHLYTIARYTQNGLTRTGSQLVNLSVEADTASIAIFKVTDVTRDTSGKEVSRSTVSFRISTAGTVSRVQETLQEPGTDLTIRLAF